MKNAGVVQIKRYAYLIKLIMSILIDLHNYQSYLMSFSLLAHTYMFCCGTDHTSKVK